MPLGHINKMCTLREIMLIWFDNCVFPVNPSICSKFKSGLQFHSMGLNPVFVLDKS